MSTGEAGNSGLGTIFSVPSNFSLDVEVSMVTFTSSFVTQVPFSLFSQYGEAPIIEEKIAASGIEVLKLYVYISCSTRVS